MSLQFNPPPNWPAPPPGWTPPEGWQPDPSWGPPPPGWNLWVEQPTYGLPTASSSPQQNSSPEPQAPHSWAGSANEEPQNSVGKKKWPWILGAVVFLFIVGSCINGSNDGEASPPTAPSTSQTAASVETPEPTAAADPVEDAAPTKKTKPKSTAVTKPKAPPKPKLPKAEGAFIEGVLKAAKSYEDASTELKETKAIKDRDKSLCASTNGSFTKWEGEITEIGSAGDGDANVSIQIHDTIRIATWNNSFSDIGDQTLIKENSKLWEKLLDMEEGQRVLVSGSFVSDGASCVKTSNATKIFGALDPDFLAKFTDVTAVK